MEAPAVLSFLDFMKIQDFSIMDLLWKEEMRRGTPGQNELSILKHKRFPELSSLISTGFLESRDERNTGANSLFEQVPADFYVHCTEWIIQEVDVCILIHSSRKHRQMSGEDTSYCPGFISES